MMARSCFIDSVTAAKQQRTKVIKGINEDKKISKNQKRRSLAVSSMLAASNISTSLSEGGTEEELATSFPLSDDSALSLEISPSSTSMSRVGTTIVTFGTDIFGIAVGAYEHHHRETAMTPADANWGCRYFMNHE